MDMVADKIKENQKILDDQQKYTKHFPITKLQICLSPLINNESGTNTNAIKNIGKDSFIAWRDALLSEAQGEHGVEDALLKLVENTFPDYVSYFENLEDAKNKFTINNAGDISSAELTSSGASYMPQADFNKWSQQATPDLNEARAKFLESLSDEDLEIALKISTLFDDGLKEATKKIEEWKSDPNNSLANEDLKIIKSISEQIEELAKAMSVLKTATEEMSEDGFISTSTYTSLIELGENYADCIEIQNGKLTLNIEKLKELELQKHNEKIAVNDATIAHLRYRRELERGSESTYNSLGKQIDELQRENALYNTMISELENATVPPEKKDSDTKDETPPQVEKFLDDYAKYQHEIAMGIKEEDEEYYAWLDKAAHDAYDGLKDYQEDLWKYEEEVYKGRKDFAEKAIQDIKDKFQGEIDYIESLKEKTEEQYDLEIEALKKKQDELDEVKKETRLNKYSKRKRDCS